MGGFKYPNVTSINLGAPFPTRHWAIFQGGDLNLVERHARVTRDDGTVTLCTLRAATLLSHTRNCCADCGRPLTLSKEVMSHSLGGVPTILDPNTSAKASQYKWEAPRDTNCWRIYYFLPEGWQTFAKISR